MELARFYLSREMFVEAKGVLDIALADERPTADNPTGLVMRAIANIMLNRPDEAIKELNDRLVGDQFDAPLWRAFAYARQGKWAEARTGFRNVEAAIATLPIELQQLALKEAMRAAIEVRDFSGATDKLHEFETIGMPRNMQPAILVLTGRLAQGLGKNEDALKAFRAAAETADRPAAAQGQLREIALRYGLGDLKRAEVISELETLTALWRGDETEIESLQMLGRLYTEENRYRDAFYVMRTALRAHPNSEMTRRIQEEAAVTFNSLFLAGKGDALPAIDALSLFYDFRELTPIGRRGDEMIRRLADRLVSVDLLYQASELLQHQIDNRLQGAARSQVATRVAVIYLMDRKPDKALARAQGHAHGRIVDRAADLAASARSARIVGHEAHGPGAGSDCQYRPPRGDPAALRHPVGRQAIRRIRRADRIALWRALEGFRAAGRRRTLRHLARGDRLCAGGRCDRARAVARKILPEDDRRGRPPRLRNRDCAVRRQCHANSAKSRRWSRPPTRWARSCAKCARAIRSSARCPASSRHRPRPRNKSRRRKRPR